MTTNLCLIVFSVTIPQLWYVYMWFLYVSTMTSVVNIGLLIVFKVLRTLKRPNKKLSPTPMNEVSIAYFVPCYNETYQEIKQNLDGFSSQVNVDAFKRCVIIVCDGRVVGKGNTKSTDNIVMTLADVREASFFAAGYKDTYGNDVDVTMGFGLYALHPVMVFVKHTNHGKRDSIIVIRKLLYHMNRPDVPTHLSRELVEKFREWATTIHGISRFDYKIGTDADTVLDPDCIHNLTQELRSDPDLYGVAGMIRVARDASKISFWRMYQNAEYMIGQAGRGNQQSTITRRLFCLPGCIQIIPIVDETCGERIMERFGRVPEKMDNIFHHILASSCEDGNHTTIMLYMFPHTRTKLCMMSNAFTSVPMNMYVFQSQRKRWIMGSLANTLFAVYRPNVHWYDRYMMILEILGTILPIYTTYSFIYFMLSIRSDTDVSILYLNVVPMILHAFNFTMPVWIPTMSFIERVDLFSCTLVYYVTTPIVNIYTTLYAWFNMDDFKWGQTREISTVSPVHLSAPTSP